MHAVSANQITDILNFSDNSVYHARGVMFWVLFNTLNYSIIWYLRVS